MNIRFVISLALSAILGLSIILGFQIQSLWLAAIIGFLCGVAVVALVTTIWED